jgi:hypothetical protein
MTPIEIQQALFAVQDADCQILARSANFSEEWLPEAQRLCAQFAEGRSGTRCAGCVFARPLARRRIAVVQVADQDSPGRSVLGFRFLVVTSKAYLNLGGDPFLVAERFPPSWRARGELADLTWPAEPIRRRTVEDVCKVLQRHGDGPNLLGGSQALVDGGRIVFERPGPDGQLLRDLWTLLPTTTRWRLWPATFAFNNKVAFDVLVAPRGSMEIYPGYLTERQAGDYPEGRYELGLQVAAEAGDQRELDILFARRSRAETWRLGLILLVVISLLLGISSFLTPVADSNRAAPPAKNDKRQPANQKAIGR